MGKYFDKVACAIIKCCDKVANIYGCKQASQLCLFYALITVDDDERMIPRVLRKMNISVNKIRLEIDNMIKESIENNNMKLENGNLICVYEQASIESEGSETTSELHLFLALLESSEDECKEIFEKYKITRETLKKSYIDAQFDRLNEMLNFGGYYMY